MPKLLALHGYSLDGAYMRRKLGHLEKLGVELVCPDAPNGCDTATVDRLYAVWDQPRESPPHWRWWDASDDGRIYAGWEATLDRVTPLLEGGPVGIIGFSQGANLATALAALSEHGKLPPIAYVIPIAGRTPRADVIVPYLTRPLRTPSLHIWGENDQLTNETCVELVEQFDPATREVVRWPGTHAIPTDGPAAAAIEQFIARRIF